MGGEIYEGISSYYGNYLQDSEVDLRGDFI